MRTVILVDGSNMWETSKMLGIKIDYSKVLSLFDGVVGAYYFTALPPKGQHSDLRPLVDHLAFNGWVVIEKEWKEYNNDGRIKIKGNMDLEIAVAMVDACTYADTVVLFTGDGDFRCIVEYAQRRGVRVWVYSSIQTKDSRGQRVPMIADELRRQANRFVDIIDIRDKIEMRESLRINNDGRPSFKQEPPDPFGGFKK